MDCIVQTRTSYVAKFGGGSKGGIEANYRKDTEDATIKVDISSIKQISTQLIVNSTLPSMKSTMVLNYPYLNTPMILIQPRIQYFHKYAALAMYFLLCVYGATALALIIVGRLKELRAVYILTVYYGVENSFRSLAPHVAQWLLRSYNTQLLLMVFLAFVSLLLAGFFGNHASLCLTNTTTNETFKWEDYISWQRKLDEARTSAAALKASISGMSSEAKRPESKCKSFFLRSPLEDTQVVGKENMYDKGFFHNFFEVIFPLSTRASFLQTKSKRS